MILQKNLLKKEIIVVLLSLILIFCCVFVYGIDQKTIVTSEDGRRFILNKDGSWEYAGHESSFNTSINSKEIKLNNPIYSKAVRFKDGDTFDVSIEDAYIGLEHKETVRLLGIDAPELDREKVFGKKALNYLSSRLAGKELYLFFDKERKRDSFCRLLAFVCLKDGTFINAELIEKGYARQYTQKGNLFYNEFTELQNRAIKNRVGLWGYKKNNIFIIYIYNHGKEEYLLLANGSSDNINISNWYVKDEHGDKLVIPDDTVITPGKDLKLCSGDTVCDSLKTTFCFECGTIWNNKSDNAYLYSANDSLVDVYEY